MKKVSLWLVVLSMIMALLPGTMVSAEGEWFDIEIVGTRGSHNVANAAASGGSYLVANDSFQGNYADLSFTTDSDETYDIWAVIGVDDSSFIGGYTFTLDGDDVFYSKSTELANQDAVGDALYTSINIASGAHAKPMKWVKLAEDKDIDAGDHALKAEVSQATSQSNRMGVMDVVRFVPSTWEWTPSSSFDAPVAPDGGSGDGDDEDDTNVITEDWFDIEPEAGVYEGVLLSRTDFERTYIYRVQGTNSAKSVTNSFELETGDTYDVWAAIGLKNAEYLCKYEFTLGSEQIYSENMKTAYENATGDALFTAQQAVAERNSLDVMWVKLAEGKTLSAGANTLTSTIAACEVGNELGIIDVVRFVPSDWEWVPESNFDDPSDMSGSNPGDGDGDEDPVVPVGYVHAEAEDATYNEASYNLTERNEASGGKVLVPNDAAAPEDTAILFDVDIPETQAYDIYALVAYRDYAASAWQIVADGEPFTQPLMFGAGLIYKININLGYDRKMQWVKLAGNVNLTEGQNDILAALPSKTHSSSWLTAIDAIRLVPSNWYWTPDASLDAPQKSLITPNDDGEIIIEAEAMGVLSGFGSAGHDNALGGKYIAATSTNVVAEAVIGFTTDEEETYDVYAAVGVTAGHDYLGGYVFELDDEEIYSNCMSRVEPDGTALYDGIVMHTGAPNAKATVYWTKIAEEQTLGAGDHTINVKTREGSGASNTCGLVDQIKLVPSTSSDPGIDIPTPPEPDDVITTDWFDIEIENGAYEGTLRTDTIGGKTYMYVSQGGGGALSTTNTFATEEDGTYDIWAIVGTHSGGQNLGSYTFTLDDKKLATLSAGAPTYKEDRVVYTGIGVAAGYPMSMVWAKVAEAVVVRAGNHTLESEITKASANTNKFGAMDMVAFIPTEWGLSKGTPLGQQIAEAVRDKYFTGDYTALTDRIEIPDVEIPVIAGTTISFGCDDESVIAADGTITRPHFNEEDLTINYNVIANYGSGALKAPIPVTILKNDKYSTSNIVVSNEITAGGTFEASVDVAVNAAADSGIQGKATLIVALYNADGSLADIAMDGADIPVAGDTLSTAIELPSNITGMKVKVFLTNGFEMGNQIMNTIAVD